MILAGDIGGTKTNIAFFEDAKRPDVVAQVWRRSSGSSSANTRCACDMRRSA